MRDDRGQKGAGGVGAEQVVTVLGEVGRVPNGIVGSKPDDSAEQKVVVQPLHQLALEANGVEGLRKQRTEQPFGNEGGLAAAGTGG